MSRDEITELKLGLKNIEKLVENIIQQHSGHYSDIVKHLQEQDKKDNLLEQKMDGICTKLDQLSPVNKGIKFFNGARDFAVFVTPYGILVAVLAWLWELIKRKLT